MSNTSSSPENREIKQSEIIYQNKPKKRLGDILLAQKWVTKSQVFLASSLQAKEDARIGEILLSKEHITTEQLYWALGQLLDMQIIDLTSTPPCLSWDITTNPNTALKNGYILWQKTDDSLTFAITAPDVINKVRNTYKDSSKAIKFVLVTPESLQSFIANTQSHALLKNALDCCPKSYSYGSVVRSSTKKIWTILIFTSVIGAIILAPKYVLMAAFCTILIALILLFFFRVVCFYGFVNYYTDTTETPSKKTIKRPKVSVLVPVYKESAILQRLVSRLQTITYPKSLLEICIIYEENDTDTKVKLNELNLPSYIKAIQVPYGRMQTKPKAMNYALDFCSGSIIGIYDAEDAPEVNQIEKVVEKFAVSKDDVACIQCVLDFYNSKTNWISRCFAIEYAILFRLILPVLSVMKLPIPLGGTSVFFKRDILERLGRWDPYNVTEDADLGYRLYRLGYRCTWINAVTYEEANYRFYPWVKQRSRWLKGLLMTARVHFRNPISLGKMTSNLAIFPMISLMIIPWVLCPMAPVILPMWLLSFGFDLPVYSELPQWFLNILVVSFILTEIMSIFLGLVATSKPQHRFLRKWLLSTIFYWPLASFASYKALFEILFRPTYWDKSEHGINDKMYEAEIEKLTLNSG